MKTGAIIVAGGSGTRMERDIPKQFLPLLGKPLLYHSLETFYAADPAIPIILVLPEKYIGYWHQLNKTQPCPIPHTIATGGDTRFQSVKNGLQKLPPGDLIAIHDGARPLLSVTLIRHLIDVATIHGNAIPVVPLTESLREITPAGSRPVPREEYRLVQTPQVFDDHRIRQAYIQPFRPLFTDDATVIESMGEQVHLTEGDSANIKITCPSDLQMAEALLQQR